jgi:hypothetical protein
MKKRKVTFLGEDLDIVFNMQAQILYEEIAGEPFDIMTVASSAKSRAVLYQAVLMASNPDKEIDAAKILEEATGLDIAPLDEAIAGSMKEFFGIPKIAEQHVPAPTEEEREEAKNA